MPTKMKTYTQTELEGMEDRELDELSAVEVMGWKAADGWRYYKDDCQLKKYYASNGMDPKLAERDMDDWHPTANANHARELEDEIEKREIELDTLRDQGLTRIYAWNLLLIVSATKQWARKQYSNVNLWEVAHASPKARTIAAILAVQDQETGNE